MSQTIQEKNKALVLDAFDTLFNRRDYAAAEDEAMRETSKSGLPMFGNRCPE
jgi:hypothetical protein